LKGWQCFRKCSLSS